LKSTRSGRRSQCSVARASVIFVTIIKCSFTLSIQILSTMTTVQSCQTTHSQNCQRLNPHVNFLPSGWKRKKIDEASKKGKGEK